MPSTSPPGSLERVGQYRLVEQIGRDEFGEHFVAEHTKLEKKVNLTILPSNILEQPGAVRRFEDEVRTVGQFSHPNLTRVSDAGVEHGRHYLVSEQIEGIPLSSLGKLPVPAACEVARQLAVALDFAERSGASVAVNPSRMMIANEGDGVVVRTPGIGLGWIGNSQNVFTNVAKTLQFALTGQEMVGHGSGVNLRKVRRDLPDELITIFQRLVAAAPNDRFASGREVVDALAELADYQQLVVLVSGNGAASAATGTDRKRHSPIVLALLVLLAVAAGAAVAALTTSNDTTDGRSAQPPNERPAKKSNSSEIANDDPRGIQVAANDRPPHLPPVPWKPGKSKNALPGLIPHPAEFPGAGRWQLFTKEPRGGIGEIRWSPDGAKIACTVFAERSIRIYDAADFKLLELLPMKYAAGGSQRSLFQWSPDSRWIAAAAIDGIQLWRSDGTPGIKIPRRGYRSFYNLTWNPNSRQIAAGESNGDVRLVKIDGSEDIAMRFAKDRKKVGTIAWSEDGKWLAAGGDDNSVQLWHADSSTGPLIDGHTGPVTGVAWKPGEHVLATSSGDGTVRIWDISSFGNALQTIRAHEGKVTAVSWRPNGEGLLTSGEDHKLRYWKINSSDNSAEMTEVGQMRPVHQNRVHWNKQGDTVIACPASYGSFRLFKFEGATLRHVHVDLPYCEATASWHPDGTRFVAGFSVYGDDLQNGNKGITGIIRLFNADGSGGQALTREMPKATSVAWSPKGDRIVSGGRDGLVRIWSFSGEQLQAFAGHQQWIKDVTFHPDGKHVASLANGGNTRVWNENGESKVVAATLPADQSPHFGYLQTVVFHPDGGKLAATFQRGVRMLDWQSESPVPVDLKGHKGWVGQAAWNHDGSVLASLDYAYDQTLRFWNSDGSEKLSVSIDTRFQPHVFAWHPDGSRVVVADDYSLRFVTVGGQQGKPFGTPHYEIRSLAWSPDGAQFVTSNYDHLQLWGTDGKLGPELVDSRPLAKMYSVDWSGDGRWIVAGGSNAIGIWNAQSLQLERLLLPLPDGEAVTFSPAGEQLYATAGASGQLVYVLEREHGRFDVGTHDEFYERVVSH